MRRLIFYLVIGFSLLLTYSCEENLNPYGDFKEQYVLNCVVRGDTTFQSATVTKSYQTPDFNPYSNTEDQTIHGATVRIWSGKDKVAILRDTTIARPEDDKYKTPYSVYCSQNFQPTPGDTITIEAILPSGKRLTSSTTAPADIIVGSGSDGFIPMGTRDYVKFVWDTSQENPIFITRLGIYYYKNENNVKTTHIAVVPVSYVQFGNEWIANYPKPSSEKGLVASMSVISKTMELISKDDPVKSNYQILGCILEVLSLDKNLSAYYNSTARGRDIYSVKLDETDISNIIGGSGVFGVYMRSYKVAFLAHSYIKSFGYTPGLEEGKTL